MDQFSIILHAKMKFNFPFCLLKSYRVFLFSSVCGSLISFMIGCSSVCVCVCVYVGGLVEVQCIRYSHT